MSIITFFSILRFWGGHLAYRLVALYSIVFATVQIEALYEVAWLVAYLVTVNFVAFMIYFLDKLIAPIGRIPLLKYIFNIRAPNNFLFFELGMLGGGIGALYGIHLNDHKTSEEYRWRRIQLWFINWVLFAGLLFLLWAAVISYTELNAFIGGVVLSFFNVVQWVVDSFSTFV